MNGVNSKVALPEYQFSKLLFEICADVLKKRSEIVPISSFFIILYNLCKNTSKALSQFYGMVILAWPLSLFCNQFTNELRKAKINVKLLNEIIWIM